MRHLKQALSIIITICLLAPFAMLPAAAADEPCACGHSPVILLPGYSGTFLFEGGQYSGAQVWPPMINGAAMRSIADVLVNTLPKLIADAGGSADKVVEEFGEILYMVDKIEMNGDGTPKYDVDCLSGGARDFRWDVMLARGQERLNNQRPITRSFLDEVPADHVYCYNSDWRRGQLDNAAKLREFVQQVKADSGHDKVSFFGISYGGQLGAAYLHFYGGADIDRVVLHSPAIRGSTLTVDVLEKEDFAFDPMTLLDFAAVYLGRELSLRQRFEGVSMDLVSDIAIRVLRKYIIPLGLKFGSFWDIIPPEHYDRLKAKYLDPVENAALIRKSDRIHYDMMPNVGESLRRAQAQGTKIAVVCGTGLPLASGRPMDSDYVIEVGSTAGVGGDRVCPYDHPHGSPDGLIDAGGAYLPDHTWFFKGQYHGQAAWDPYARSLYNKWLFSDDLRDVYSDPEYPQFRDSCFGSDGLEARFSNSVSGYLTADDDTLLLTNLSAYEVSLLAVEAEGLAGFDAPLYNRMTLFPGETVRLRYDARLPAQPARFTLRARFVRESPVPSSETREFVFTAIPRQTPVSPLLRYQQGPAAAPPRLRLANALLVALSLSASLFLASFAVGMMYKGKGKMGKLRAAKK